MHIKKKLWALPFIIVTTALVMIGCSELELSGTAPDNIRPEVTFSNVPNDSSYYSSNPEVNWFGNDVDGQIIQYHYKVILKDSLAVALQEFLGSFSTPDSSWISVETESDTVALYASPEPDEYLEQYIFLCAEDDDGAYSDLAYKLFARNNHAPDTHIEVIESDTIAGYVYYSYPYLTDYYDGLRLQWEGSDSLDFPDEQPDFEFHWTLYGPFDDEPYIGLDSSTFDTTMIYTAYDSTSNQTVTWESYDSTNLDVWVDDEDVTLYNLRTGYYVFRVLSKDDAEVVDQTPLDTLTGEYESIKIIRFVEPFWVTGEDAEELLVLDFSRYRNFPGENEEEDSNYVFYRKVIQSAGIDTLTEVRWVHNDSSATVERATLIEHPLILVLNDDWFEPIPQNISIWFQKYLGVGGQMMVTGRYCFRVGARTNYMDSLYYGEAGVGTGVVAGNNQQGYLARDYFNLYYSIFPGWNFQNNLNHEMTGATSVYSGLPNVSFDTTKVQQVVGTFYTVNTNYLPAVEKLVRNAESQTLYEFKSFQPEFSDFDGFPVANYYAPRIMIGENMRTAFKTSYFAFPLYYAEESQAIDVLTTMFGIYGIQ
ncbi:MAG: hypothetical protein GF307_06195 [candidate division Zixibacteria bacterium]|nr:hypothetical protein [candidate division Zixibacteria bacterium]